MSSIFKQFAHPVTIILLVEWKVKHRQAQLFDVKIICGGIWSASLWVVIRNGLDRIREVVFGNQQLWTGCPNSLLWCYLISHLVACLLSVWFSANRKKKHKAKEEIFGNNGKEYSILGFLKINFTIVRKIRPLKLILFWSKAVY